MEKAEATAEQAKPRWYIDLNWYEQSKRSFSNLAKERLCAKCRKKLNAQKKESSDSDLISIIKGCCGSDAKFITAQLPIMESIFRLFLNNGNEPLEAEEISDQLIKQYKIDNYRASPEVLSRLLKNDQYYGLRPAA